MHFIPNLLVKNYKEIPVYVGSDFPGSFAILDVFDSGY